ncbi:MAG TPA: Phenylacetic acid catabolic protein, partial [Bacteroidota bacterium]
NEQVRQEFIDLIVPQIRALGFDVPDANCKLNDQAGHYDYSQPDWEELKRVVNGNGPCNKERLETRRKAHEDGKWVREALAVSNKKVAA